MIKTIAEGVTLNYIQSKKFKDICISINFINKNEEKKATERSLLAMMLVDRCARYDTKKKMNEVCDHLYGCTLGSRTVTYGKAHCVEIRSKIINPLYIHENHNILNDWLNFISDILFQPLMKHESFDADLFQENKNILMSKIKRKEDDAQSYTIMKAFEIAGKDQPLSIRVRGSKELLEQPQAEDMVSCYHSMMKEDQIEIIVCGDLDENAFVKLITQKLSFSDRKACYETYYLLKTQECGISREEKNQPQTNIAMVYATNVTVKDADYPALKVANGILGQLPSSYLFQVVREQNSLCYSISSNLISYDGACLISTGIEEENIDKTLRLIQEQIQRCKQGDISDELLETTKKMLVGALMNSLDEMSSIIGYQLGNSILKRKYPIEENIQAVSAVTKDDVVKVFQKMTHVATFICASKEKAYE